jgi:hypothetical protein
VDEQRAARAIDGAGVEGAFDGRGEASSAARRPLRLIRSTRWSGLVAEVLDATDSASLTRTPL